MPLPIAGMPEGEKLIYTIGHSTLGQEQFIALLQEHGIVQVADVRRFPASVRYPQFNQASLSATLPFFGMLYMHWPGLGGRRRPTAYSRHKEWKNGSFRAYADYMDTAEFKIHYSGFCEFALEAKTAIMCSEALWWRCHRSLLADRLKEEKWKVMHIFSDLNHQAVEHPFTGPYLERHAS